MLLYTSQSPVLRRVLWLIVREYANVPESRLWHLSIASIKVDQAWEPQLDGLVTGRMAIANPTILPHPRHRPMSKFRDYCTLTKPEVNLLILMTTSAGYYLASQGPFKIVGLVNTLIGTLLVASGTATLNQWMERVWDGQMRRTASRPLPSGRLSSREALLFGLVLSVAGGLYLAITVNLLSAFLAISTLLSYLLVYTPLKRLTPLSTLLGAVPGAMPTLIGWAGASASLDRRAWFLFAILFLWQFPHFLAIALMYREDYDRAGYRMLPRFDLDSRFTRAEMVVFTAALVVITMLPLVDHGGFVYTAGMLLAGAFMLYHVTKLARSASRSLARAVVHASVIYLPVVLGLMIACKR
jgi:heme o synthase